MSRRLGISLPLVLMTSVAIGGGFRYYPEAAVYTPPDTEANRQFTDALRPGVTIRAWLTQARSSTSWAFTAPWARNTSLQAGCPRRSFPAGQLIQKTFVIFDGVPDLVTSRQWIRIQRPFVGAASDAHGGAQHQEVRDVTEIVLTERKPIPKQQGAKPQPHQT
jgi:hypothetical protein